MFNPPSHKVIHENHNKCISNPLNNNGTQVIFDQSSWNSIQIPKWKWIDPWKFQAWTLEEPPTHPQVSYKTKLQCKIFQMPSQKIFHSNSNFHFGLVNISSKHSSIPFQNNWRWEITQHTINIENQQFFRSKRWWMYMWMCRIAFDHCYRPWGHI